LILGTRVQKRRRT